MLNRRFFLAILAFFLPGCAHHQPLPPRPSPIPKALRAQVLHHGKYITQNRKIGSFSQIDAKGRINLRLHTGYKKPGITLRGDPRDLAELKTVVDGTTLFITLGKGFPHYGEVTADVRGQVLNRFSYKGIGVITGDRLHTRYMELYLENQGSTRLGGSLGLQILQITGPGTTVLSGITSYDLKVRLIGNPHVQLSGYVRLSKLDIDSGSLSLYWVRSTNLRIVGRERAVIQLAGTTNRLNVELWGYAQFKGRYLRAQRSFVKTHDHSVAEIATVNHQADLASDASDIYYYNIPNTRADFMANNGSILDMRDWSPYDLEEYTRYNKHFP